MVMHIYHLVHEELRPFSYVDFIKFQVDGREYGMAHGTFRNNISRLMKEGLVEVSYKSNVTFYTLTGLKFNRASRLAVTGNHTGVPIISLTSTPPSQISSNPLYRIVSDLPLGKNSAHDIRLRFVSPRIYAITSSLISKNALDSDYTVNPKSKDILLPAWKIRDLLIKVTIHRTDTVSVVIGCSLNPVALDFDGIIRLTNALSVVEERLSRIVEGFGRAKDSRYDDKGVGIARVPLHSEWTVTMWHFGADASVEYSGEKFSVTWQTAEDTLVRAYSKVMNDNKIRIRLERQECPKVTIANVIEQELSRDSPFI
jgi:DNA-binding transcriptional ArsR family regulator